jgi:hypothetical protein
VRYTYKTAEVTLECELEYTPEQLGFLEDGLQMVPDTPAQIELVSAKVNGLEMVELLAEWVVDDIIDKAMLEVESSYA